MIMPFTTFLSGQSFIAEDINTALDETLWTKRQTADQTRTSTTALLDSPDLQFALPASSEWVFESCIFATGGTGGDIRLRFSLDGSASDFLRIARWCGITTITTNTNSIDHGATDAFSSVDVNAGTIATGTLTTLIPTGYLAVSTVAATFKLSFSQVVSNASTTTLRTGSFISLSRVG